MNEEGEPPAEDDDEDAWSLFDDREALERKMTDHVRALLHKQGVNVADEDDEDESE